MVRHSSRRSHDVLALAECNVCGALHGRLLTRDCAAGSADVNVSDQGCKTAAEMTSLTTLCLNRTRITHGLYNIIAAALCTGMYHSLTLCVVPCFIVLLLFSLLIGVTIQEKGT